MNGVDTEADWVTAIRDGDYTTLGCTGLAFDQLAEIETEGWRSRTDALFCASVTKSAVRGGRRRVSEHERICPMKCVWSW
jgi:hypothetical protein